MKRTIYNWDKLVYSSNTHWPQLVANSGLCILMYFMCFVSFFPGGLLFSFQESCRPTRTQATMPAPPAFTSPLILATLAWRRELSDVMFLESRLQWTSSRCARIHACMHAWMDACMHACMDGWMDGWMECMYCKCNAMQCNAMQCNVM